MKTHNEALRLVNLKPRAGGLSIAAAKRGAVVVSIDFSPAMTRRLRTRIAQENLVNVTAETMDGQSMDISDDAFDGAFSVFGLIFFPDYAKGLHPFASFCKAQLKTPMKIARGGFVFTR